MYCKILRRPIHHIDEKTHFHHHYKEILKVTIGTAIHRRKRSRHARSAPPRTIPVLHTHVRHHSGSGSTSGSTYNGEISIDIASNSTLKRSQIGQRPRAVVLMSRLSMRDVRTPRLPRKRVPYFNLLSVRHAWSLLSLPRARHSLCAWCAVRSTASREPILLALWGQALLST
jgi:hypothetical protein